MRPPRRAGPAGSHTGRGTAPAVRLHRLGYKSPAAAGTVTIRLIIRVRHVTVIIIIIIIMIERGLGQRFRRRGPPVAWGLGRLMSKK
jgi:hypothetical protein